MWTTFPSILSCMLVCSWTACTSSSRVTVTKSEIDVGSVAELTTGDTLEIVLKANPTTGYGWTVAAVDSAVLRPVGATYVPDKVMKGIVGSGGSSFIRFEAVGAGSLAVLLQYSRSFEKDKPPAKAFEMGVIVRD